MNSTDGISSYFESYKILPSKTLKQMLLYKNYVQSEPARWTAIEYILASQRIIRFRMRKSHVEKLL